MNRSRFGFPRPAPILRVLALALGAAAVSACGPSAGPPVPTPTPGPPVPIGGNYGSVVRDHLIGEHICWRTGPERAEFLWIFRPDDRFEIRPTGAAFPVEALRVLVGGETPPGRVAGTWRLENGRLHLSDIRADDREGLPDVEIPLFRTPIVRLNFENVQYALNPAPRDIQPRIEPAAEPETIPATAPPGR